MEAEIDSAGLILSGLLARPRGETLTTRQGLVVCHGFPDSPRGATMAGDSLHRLANRLATEAGWVVLAPSLRGTGRSEGDFSAAGWRADLAASIAHLRAEPEVVGVWLAGFGTGGSLALCAAGQDTEVRGVAALGAPADFGDWSADPRRFLETCRRLGVIRQPGYPSDVSEWAGELREVRPLDLVGAIPPRPVLLIHGANDEKVPIVDARALADAADAQVDLRVLSGAGHRLRHDPRAVAILLGWLERQPK